MPNDEKRGGDGLLTGAAILALAGAYVYLMRQPTPAAAAVPESAVMREPVLFLPPTAPGQPTALAPLPPPAAPFSRPPVPQTEALAGTLKQAISLTKTVGQAAFKTFADSGGSVVPQEILALPAGDLDMLASLSGSDLNLLASVPTEDLDLLLGATTEELQAIGFLPEAAAGEEVVTTGVSSLTTITGGISTVMSVVGPVVGAVTLPFAVQAALEQGKPAKAALSLAGTGAGIGSVVPGIGTLIGAGIGALAGALLGLFGGKTEQRNILGLVTVKVGKADRQPWDDVQGGLAPPENLKRYVLAMLLGTDPTKAFLDATGMADDSNAQRGAQLAAEFLWPELKKRFNLTHFTDADPVVPTWFRGLSDGQWSELAQLDPLLPEAFDPAHAYEWSLADFQELASHLDGVPPEPWEFVPYPEGIDLPQWAYQLRNELLTAAA